MRHEVINGHKFEFYDTIDELPISRFHKYSKYILVESGIGSDIGAIDAHISKILRYMGVDIKKAHQELLNLRQCLYMISTGIDTKYRGFLYLTHKVDGVIWEDFSDSGVDALYEMIIEESVKRMCEVMGEVKSKIDSELSLYFPDLFSSSVEKNYVDLIRRRALLQLAHIIDGADTHEEVERLTNEMVKYHKPKSFEGTESEEIKFDKQFETMCLAMSKEFGGIVKNYSVMEFYSAYESLDRQSKELKKIKSRRKK